MDKTPDYNVIAEHLSIGIISSAASLDGELICIDFALHPDPSNALRLAFPSDQIEILKEQLSRLQKALDDPKSGLRFSGLTN